MLMFIAMMACKNEKKKQVDAPKIETVSYSYTDSSPDIHIENVQVKHRDAIIESYKEIEAYYGKNLSKTVDIIHFKGQEAPWVPQTDDHYCIDVKHNDSTEKEHIYYFASRCRSKSTLMREFNRILYRYIDIETCEDLCACMKDEQIDLRFDSKGKLDCKSYCGSTSWEHTCDTFSDLKACCKK